MTIKLLFCLYLLIHLSSIGILAQNEDRRHWKYIDDLSTLDPTSDLSKLSAISWAGGCYIGDSKAVAYASGDLFLFDYDNTDGEWTRLQISEYYRMNAQGEREIITNNDKIPNNLVGSSLAYVGDNKILLGPGRLGSVASVNYKQTWVFDLDDNSWTLMIDESSASQVTIPLIYDYGICHLIEDKVLIFGGRNSKSNHGGRNNTYTYDLSNNQWLDVTNNINSTPPPRAAHSLASLGEGSAILFGGSSDGTIYDETWVFDYENGTPQWTLINTVIAPGRRYYHLLQKLSSDIAILYGGTTSYSSGIEHYNDLWRFNYDRENHTGSWVDISFSVYPDRNNHNSNNQSDYLYYPSGSTEPLANDNYRHIDGEIDNNGGGGYGANLGNSNGAGNSLRKDHWGRYHGKRRATINAFLGNDRILLHGGDNFFYNGIDAYDAGSGSMGKTYVFDLGIPDVFVDTVVNNTLIEGVDVTLSIGQLNDDRGEAINESTLSISIKYKRTNGADDGYVIVPVTMMLNNNSMVTTTIELPNLPPNTEIEILGVVDVDGFGINYSDPYIFTTAGGNKTLHLLNSNSNGISGVNDYTINNSDTLDLNSDFTIAQWIKLDKPTSRYTFKRNSSSSPVNLIITDNQITFITKGNSNTYTSLSSTGLNLSEAWHYVVVIFDKLAQMQYVYLDGEMLIQTANEGFIKDLHTNNFVMDVQYSLNIEEFQFWKQALTQDQIIKIMYQPVMWGFPNEVKGAVDLSLIEGVVWDDLVIYYKGDYLDEATPFTSAKKGCVCEVSGVDGLSLVNTVQTTQTDTGFHVHTNLPYINWTRDASNNPLIDDFNNSDNWYASMNPTSSAIESYQSIVININSDAYYPRFKVIGFDYLHTLVLRESTKLDIDKECPLYITNKIVHDKGVTILLENNAKLLFGEKSATSIDNDMTSR